MGVGAGLYMYDVVVKMSRLAISSTDDFLSEILASFSGCRVSIVAPNSDGFQSSAAGRNKERCLKTRTRKRRRHWSPMKLIDAKIASQATKA